MSGGCEPDTSLLGCNEVGIMVWIIWTEDGYVTSDGSRTPYSSDAAYWYDKLTAMSMALELGGSVVEYRKSSEY